MEWKLVSERDSRNRRINDKWFQIHFQSFFTSNTTMVGSTIHIINSTNDDLLSDYNIR